MTVSSAIKSLVKYAQKNGLIDVLDETYAINGILGVLNLDSIDDDEIFENAELEDMLKVLLLILLDEL